MTTPAASPPKPLWRLFLRMGGWFAILFFGLSIAFTLISHGELVLADRFDTEGRSALARVDDRYMRESRDSDGDPQTTYYFVLTYETEAGTAHRVTESVGQSLYRNTEEGSEIPIRYLSSAPERIETRAGQTRTASRVFQVVGLIFGVGALATLWIFGRRAVAAVRARRYGARETAMVTDLKRTRWKVNGRYLYRLIWREQSGRVGKSLADREGAFSAATVAREIIVYQGIDRAWWVGDVGERDAG